MFKNWYKAKRYSSGRRKKIKTIWFETHHFFQNYIYFLKRPQNESYQLDPIGNFHFGVFSKSRCSFEKNDVFQIKLFWFFSRNKNIRSTKVASMRWLTSCQRIFAPPHPIQCCLMLSYRNSAFSKGIWTFFLIFFKIYLN